MTTIMGTTTNRNSINIKVATPSGMAFVTIVENSKTSKPEQVLINIGKTGHELSAWADALGRIVSLTLRQGVPMTRIISEISNITSGKMKQLQSGARIRSGPEGISYALIKYDRDKCRSGDFE